MLVVHIQQALERRRKKREKEAGEEKVKNEV